LTRESLAAPPGRRLTAVLAPLLVTTGVMLALPGLWPSSPVLLQQCVLACTTMGLQLMLPVVTPEVVARG
jgi:hypothetical protein